MKQLLLVLAMVCFGACTTVQTQVTGTVVVDRPGAEPAHFTYAAVESHNTGGLALLCILTGIFYGGGCWAYLALPFDDHEYRALLNALTDIASLGCGRLEKTRVDAVGYSAAPRTVTFSSGGQPVDAKALCGTVLPGTVQGVTRSYDRFKDTTLLRTSAQTIGTGAVSEIAAIFPGGAPKPEAPAKFFWRVDSRSPEWRYLHCHSFAMLVDGKPVDLGAPKHDGRVHKNFVAETITIELPPAAIAAMAEAAKIEVRLCRDETALDPSTILRFKAMASSASPSANEVMPTDPAG